MQFNYNLNTMNAFPIFTKLMGFSLFTQTFRYWNRNFHLTYLCIPTVYSFLLCTSNENFVITLCLGNFSYRISNYFHLTFSKTIFSISYFQNLSSFLDYTENFSLLFILLIRLDILYMYLKYVRNLYYVHNCTVNNYISTLMFHFITS